MKPELEKAITDLLPELTEAAQTVFGADYHDHLQEILLTTLQRDEDFIEQLISIGQLKYYIFKSLWFRKNIVVRDAMSEKNKLKDYTNVYVAFHSPTATYSPSEVVRLQKAIDELPFVEQKLIRYYLATDGNASKLAREISLNTDGVGIPHTMVARIIREAKKKLKKQLNEGNSSM